MCVCLHGAAHVSSHAHISHGHAFHGHGEERLVDTPFIALSALAGSAPRPCSTQTARPHRTPTTQPLRQPHRQPCWQWAHGSPACGQRRFRTCITRALISRTPFPASYFPASHFAAAHFPALYFSRSVTRCVATCPCFHLLLLLASKHFNHSTHCEACP